MILLLLNGMPACVQGVNCGLTSEEPNCYLDLIAQ